MTDGLLVLSNGLYFRGRLLGAPIEATGEVIFNTSLTLGIRKSSPISPTRARSSR